jgi:cbb3-type cytochrome oxidase maturation protein
VTLAYLVIFASFVLFALSVVLALAWALRNGQMQDFQRGATAIFDPDEPIGATTDAFPGSAKKAERSEEESHE